MSETLRTVCLILLCLVVPVRPGRAEFCQDLERIVAAAGDGFAELREELITNHVDPVSDTRVVWRCLPALPGANRCEVEWLRSTYTYQLLWLRATLEAHAETYAAVKALLVGCGVSEKQVSKSGKSTWFVLESRDDLDIVLAYNLNRVRLSISVVGFPNPGLE